MREATNEEEREKKKKRKKEQFALLRRRDAGDWITCCSSSCSRCTSLVGGFKRGRERNSEIASLSLSRSNSSERARESGREAKRGVEKRDTREATRAAARAVVRWFACEGKRCGCQRQQTVGRREEREREDVGRQGSFSLSSSLMRGQFVTATVQSLCSRFPVRPHACTHACLICKQTSRTDRSVDVLLEAEPPSLDPCYSLRVLWSGKSFRLNEKRDRHLIRPEMVQAHPPSSPTEINLKSISRNNRPASCERYVGRHMIRDSQSAQPLSRQHLFLSLSRHLFVRQE